MITFGGTHIQTIGGACGTPSAQDLAVQAGRICRYGGSVWSPLLMHLVLVGLLTYRRATEITDPLFAIVNCIWGLIHDCHECVTGEIPRPFKCDCMRREQNAIDERLAEKFIGPELIGLIDHKLIKQCDLDACDLEAVELGLPNYEEIRLASTYLGAPMRPQVYKNVDDRRLLLDLLRSPFYRNTTSQFSPGVIAFQDALLLAEARKYDEFLEAVKSWNLL